MARILVVDDEEDIRELMSDQLSLEGFEVLLAANGSEALDLLAKNEVDLVISDVRMPVLGGGELLRQLCNQERRPPVFLMSGYSDFDFDSAIQAGAEYFFDKPIAMNALIEKIQAKLQPSTESPAP